MKNEVAKLAGAPIEQVYKVGVEEVRALYGFKINSTVLELATQEPATYWRVGQICYLDDAGFGEVVALDDLRCCKLLGLYSIHW